LRTRSLVVINLIQINVIYAMAATAEKNFGTSAPDNFPSAYEHQVNENLRRFAQAAETRHQFYPTEHEMPRKKDFNRRRFQIIICVVLFLVAIATILAAVGTSTGFLSGTEASRVSACRASFVLIFKVRQTLMSSASHRPLLQPKASQTHYQRPPLLFQSTHMRPMHHCP
jgi:hypothetical protein